MQPLAVTQGVLNGDCSTTAVPREVEIRQVESLDKLDDISGLFLYFISVLRVATLTATAQIGRYCIDGVWQYGEKWFPPPAGSV
jgi:hypothetical protein